MDRIQNFEKHSERFLGNAYWMILIKYKVNVTNSNFRKKTFSEAFVFSKSSSQHINSNNSSE